jgi:hypothetical protein
MHAFASGVKLRSLTAWHPSKSHLSEQTRNLQKPGEALDSFLLVNRLNVSATRPDDAWRFDCVWHGPGLIATAQAPKNKRRRDQGA